MARPLRPLRSVHANVTGSDSKPEDKDTPDATDGPKAQVPPDETNGDAHGDSTLEPDLKPEFSPLEPPSQYSKALVFPKLEDCLPYYEPNLPERVQEKAAEYKDQVEHKIKNTSAWQRLKAWWYASGTKPTRSDRVDDSDNNSEPPQEEDVVEEQYVPPEPSTSFHPHHTQLHPRIALLRQPHKVRRVAFIGVHGFFPMRAIRSVLGEPTGTSLKLASEAAAAVHRWADSHGLAQEDLEITQIALEAEGKVQRRVADLYAVLVNNWLDALRAADCVFFAAHSQGTPVAVHLLAKLIDDGHVDPHTHHRLGLLGIAGVNLGPFQALFANPLLRAYSTVENPSLRELFQFAHPDSPTATAYLASLTTVLKANAKLVFLGSVNDQVVPLYSSLCAHTAHPNVFRAAYLNAAELAPEFISDLVALALRLKNIGAPDHGLLRELSASLAGSLTGSGHSAIYSEPAVYDLALRFVLETTDHIAPASTATSPSARIPSAAVPLVVDKSFTAPKPAQNPYVLPWALHGVFTEAASRPEFSDALARLVDEFARWRPQHKALKDVKYRLAAVQSKL